MAAKVTQHIYVPHLGSTWPLYPPESGVGYSKKNETGYTPANLYGSTSFHEALMMAVLMVVSKYATIFKFYVDTTNFKPILVLGMTYQEYVNLFSIRLPSAPIQNIPHPLLAEQFFVHRFWYVYGDGWKLFTRPLGFFAQTYRTSKPLDRNHTGQIPGLVNNTIHIFSVAIEDEHGHRYPLW